MATRSATRGKAAEETKEVVVKKSGALATQMPDFMKGTGGQGLEGIDSSDIETPRLILLQPTSSQVEDFEEARAGMFWHNMLNEPVGTKDKGFEGVICYVDKRAILWRQRPPVDVGGILARSDDLKTWNPSNATFADVKLKGRQGVVTYKTRQSVAASRLLEWGSSDPEDPNSAPAATLMTNAVLQFPEYPEIMPAVFSFQRSSSKVSRKLMGRLKMAPCASFGIKFRFGSELVDKGGNKFYIPTFEQIGFVEDPLEFERYESLYKALKKTGLKMAEEIDDADIINGEAETGDEPGY